MRTKLGPGPAITATAHKIAIRVLYPGQESKEYDKLGEREGFLSFGITAMLPAWRDAQAHVDRKTTSIAGFELCWPGVRRPTLNVCF
jgi:hypothetical protein